jgi:hypothetical protein
MASEPKLHHYVPRFHLSRFANEHGQVWTFDKVTNKIFATGPMALAAERQFYTLPEFEGTDVDPLFLEKQFAELEGEAFNITSCWLRQIDEAISDETKTQETSNNDAARRLKQQFQEAGRVKIPGINRKIMSEFIALQFFRTADAREILKLFAEQNVYKGKIDKDEARALHAHMLCQLADGKGMVSDLAKQIGESIWIFARNETAKLFHTSDIPVLLKTCDNRMWLKGPGIFQPGVYVVYAITPRLVLYCKERSFWGALDQFDSCVSPVVLTPEMIEHENSGHAGLSSRFVFSAQNDFDAAKSFVNDRSNFDIEKERRD